VHENGSASMLKRSHDENARVEISFPSNHSRLSVFNITSTELTNLLQSARVVSAPVRALGDGHFQRTVDVGRVIGYSTLKNGGGATTFLRVLTDEFGNLVTAFPL